MVQGEEQLTGLQDEVAALTSRLQKTGEELCALQNENAHLNAMLMAQQPPSAKSGAHVGGAKSGSVSKQAAIPPLEANKYRAEVARLTSELAAAKELGERQQHLHACVWGFLECLFFPNSQYICDGGGFFPERRPVVRSIGMRSVQCWSSGFIRFVLLTCVCMVHKPGVVLLLWQLEQALGEKTADLAAAKREKSDLAALYHKNAADRGRFRTRLPEPGSAVRLLLFFVLVFSLLPTFLMPNRKQASRLTRPSSCPRSSKV
jgi:hypothetical protein